MLRDKLWNYFESTGSIETYLLYKTLEDYKVETSKDLSRILDTNPLNKNLN